MGKRVTLLVDGFNLLFSARESSTAPGSSPLQWLDVRGLLFSYLSVIGRGAALGEVHFLGGFQLTGPDRAGRIRDFSGDLICVARLGYIDFRRHPQGG